MTFTDTLLSNDKIFFVGNFEKKESGINLIKFNWNIDIKQKKDKRGRVYFFVEKYNDTYKILKIGKSNDKNGLNGTIGFYVSTLSGTPSITRYCLHNLIYQKLSENKEILVYSFFSNSIKTKVNGIIKKYSIEIPLDITYIEKIYLDEYYEEYAGYPEWNFKENNKNLPLNLIESYGIFIQNKKKTRKE